MPPPAPERTGDVPSVAPPRRRRRGYQKSGFYALKTTLKQLGPRVLDKRTSLGKALAAWKADLVRDLGGPDALSTQQTTLIELLCRQKLLLESIDAWLLVQPSLVNARRRALLPVVRERQALADALSKYLAQLGLERRAKPVPDLSSYLAGKATAAAEPAVERKDAVVSAKDVVVSAPPTTSMPPMSKDETPNETPITPITPNETPGDGKDA